MIWSRLYMYMYACKTLSVFLSSHKGEDVVIAKKEEEENLKHEPVSN